MIHISIQDIYREYFRSETTYYPSKYYMIELIFSNMVDRIKIEKQNEEYRNYMKYAK